MSAAEPYEQLAELAEAALAAAEEGRLDELPALLERVATLRATLPERPDPAARAQLERAASAHRQLRARLGASLAAVRSQLGRADRGRRAARSYATVAAHAGAPPPSPAQAA